MLPTPNSRHLETLAVSLMLIASGACESETPATPIPSWDVSYEIGKLEGNAFITDMSIAVTGQALFVAADVHTPKQVAGNVFSFDIRDQRGSSSNAKRNAMRRLLVGANSELVAVGRRPRLIGDSLRRVHAVWGEFEGRDNASAASFPPRPTVILHSHLNRSGAWSAPDVAFRAQGSDEVFWMEPGRGMTIVPSGGIELALALTSTGIVHLRKQDTIWESSIIGSDVVRAIYSDIASTCCGHRVIAFVGAVGGSAGPGNNVYVLLSKDDGQTFSDPMVVSAMGYRRATSVRVLSDAEGGWHLLWGQSLSPGIVPDVVRHVYSVDGGLQWSTPVDIPLPFGISKWYAEIDRRGILHLLAFSPGNAGDAYAKLEHSWWKGDWTSPIAVVEGRSLIDVAVTREVSTETIAISGVSSDLSRGDSAAVEPRLWFRRLSYPLPSSPER